MFGSKIKLDRDLFERCQKHAKEIGYSSVQEFVIHAIEKELRDREKKSLEDKKAITDRLKGLGYIE